MTIYTIQRPYSMLRGEELAEDADELSGAELAKALGGRTRDVAYNPTVPIEKFDFIVTDECHRSIYNLWRQVFEYFDASLIGLTVTPAPQTIAYLHQNCGAEYNHERAATNGVQTELFPGRTLVPKASSSPRTAPMPRTSPHLTRSVQQGQRLLQENHLSVGLSEVRIVASRRKI